MIDYICFSHLRWDFVYQRPQHLLSRFGKTHRIFFIEEPVFDSPFSIYTITKEPTANVWRLVPHLQSELNETEVIEHQRRMLQELIHTAGITDFVAWYYTPMAFQFTDQLFPLVTVYDCMDELSAFKFAPTGITHWEKKLMDRADIVFTGGYNLYEAKKDKHHNIFPFPSSIDKAHFSSARILQEEPADQAGITGPKLGFFGVIDERFDRDLLDKVASARPDLSFIIIGPIVKIDRDALPHHSNIHYLGSKTYDELPLYLSGWDIAIMPFAKNESTRYISPTKTPEYLSGGQPVISTSITDVVRSYGNNGLVHIADTAEDFIRAADELLAISSEEYTMWLQKVDASLATTSWDSTHLAMEEIIQKEVNKAVSQRLHIDFTSEKLFDQKPVAHV